MIDYELFKTILTNEDEGYIENGDFINNDLLILLASSKVEKVKSLFKKGDVSLYDVEFNCEKCGKTFVLGVTKTKLYEQLQHLRGNKKRDSMCILCPHCEQIRKEEENYKWQQQMQKRNEIESVLTKRYIEIYLDPNRSWKKGVNNWRKINDLKDDMGNQQSIEGYIRKMKYSDFLKTPYWIAIAERVKIRAKNSCQVCNSTKNLNVHHRSYQNHGTELYHMEDLICLCKECHTKYHFE